MSTQNATGFQVGADINPFEQAMRRMTEAARNGQSGVADALGGLATGPLAGLKVAFAAISGILAGGFMQNAINETAKMTENAMDLGRALGISTNEARAIQIAMEDIGASTGEYEGVAKGMAKRLKENEEEMNKMGLATRDASGHLRPMTELVADGIKVLGDYKEGTDRMLASQILFGKGLDASSKLMVYNQQTQEDARRTMEEMGLTVGVNAVAAWEAYDAAQDKAAFAAEGMSKAVGDSLMPVAVTLTNMFNSIMPAAIVVVRGALSGLTSAFLFVKNGVIVLWETLQLMLYSVLEPLRGLTEMLGRAMTGDFSGAVNAFKSIGNNMADAWSGSLNRMADESRKTADQVYNLFARDDQAGSGGGPGAGTRDYVDPKQKEDKKDKAEHVKEPTAMPTYEAVLTQQKLAFESENTLREFGKQQELAYWRDILNTYTVGSKDRTSIALKMGKLELDILRQSAKDKSAITQLQAEDWKSETLDYIAELDARAAFERDQGNLTQAGYLDRQAAFNQMRQQAELDFIAQKLEVAKLDPDTNLVLLEQLELQKLEIKRKYKALEGDLGRQSSLEGSARYRDMFSSIQSGLQGIIKQAMQGTLTLKGIFQGVFSAIANAVMDMLAKTAAKWLMDAIMKKAISTVTSLSQITAQAGVAGAAAVASTAAIPFIGPALAPAAGAAAFSAAMAFAPFASASGGYDIPAGLDPITQLHAQEMVLPAKHAKVIRNLADDGPGQGGGGGDTGPIHIYGSPDDSIKLKDLGKVLKKMKRNFEFV